MDAHTAQAKRLGGAGDVALFHEGHENTQLAKCNVARDVDSHNPPVFLIALQHLFQLFLGVQPRHFALFEAGFGFNLNL
ncbi:hypothetical protein D3C85_1327820 [compost metagenome]